MSFQDVFSNKRGNHEIYKVVKFIKKKKDIVK